MHLFSILSHSFQGVYNQRKSLKCSINLQRLEGYVSTTKKKMDRVPNYYYKWALVSMHLDIRKLKHTWNLILEIVYQHFHPKSIQFYSSICSEAVFNLLKIHQEHRLLNHYFFANI